MVRQTVDVDARMRKAHIKYGVTGHARVRPIELSGYWVGLAQQILGLFRTHFQAELIPPNSWSHLHCRSDITASTLFMAD